MLSDDPVDLRGHTEVGRLGATYVSDKSGRKEVYPQPLWAALGGHQAIHKSKNGQDCE